MGRRGFPRTRRAAWWMATGTPGAGVNAHSEAEIECRGNSNPAIHGGLLVDPVNRHHFRYEDGSRYFLMGYEADWLWGADMKDPERKVMHRLIDQMAARAFNHVLVNVYAHDPAGSNDRLNEWDYGPPRIYGLS